MIHITLPLNLKDSDIQYLLIGLAQCLTNMLDECETSQTHLQTLLDQLEIAPMAPMNLKTSLDQPETEVLDKLKKDVLLTSYPTISAFKSKL